MEGLGIAATTGRVGCVRRLSAQMLLRSNRVLKLPEVSSVVDGAVGFIMERQGADGSWTDDRWPTLDATSVSVGTLLFYVRDPKSQHANTEALSRGMGYIHGQRRRDRLWYYKPSASPVTISAHLLQKCATYGDDAKLVRESALALIALQNPEGHWDKRNVDHTCDATRCLLLCASVLGEAEFRSRVIDAAGRAVTWLLEVGRDGCLGDRPGSRPHVERTCDGIDTMLKFRTFVGAEQHLIGFWR
jgi:hypothetical protein